MGRTGSQRESGMSYSQRISSNSQRINSSQRSTTSQRNSQRESNTQASTSSQRAREELSPEELKNAVQNVLTFIIADLPIKRKMKKEDIVTNVLNKSNRQYATIMKKVQQIFSQDLGLLIVKTEKKSDDSFIIVNKESENFIKLMSPTDNQNINYLILTVVLSSIFMNRGTIFESHLLQILETVGFLDDEFYEHVPGKHNKMSEYVHKLIKNEFVRQMYLESNKCDRPEKPQQPPLPEDGKHKVLMFKWGLRALVEVKVDDVVDYLTQMYDGQKPANFPLAHYKDLKLQQQNILDIIDM